MMTERQIKAMNGAIWLELSRLGIGYDVHESRVNGAYIDTDRLAKAAFEHSDAKYIPMLVEALREIEAITRSGSFGDGSWATLSPAFRRLLCEIASKPLSKLPEDYR